MAGGHERNGLISHALLSMLLGGIDWKRPGRTWHPLMAVKTRLDTRSVTEGETRFQMDEKSATWKLAGFSVSGGANRSLSAMCEQWDGLPDDLYPLTFDRAIRHSLHAFSCRMPRGQMPTTDLLQGTLDLLILRTLALESMHGWGIAQRIQQLSKDALQIGQGSLYPALHRLEYKGWIKAEWGASENNRKAKFYSLTKTGQKQLQAELEDWGRISTAIALVLK